MTWRFDRTTDRWVGHDYPWVVGSSFGDFVLNELELGGRAAVAVNDPEQAWWELDNLGRREEPGAWDLASRTPDRVRHQAG